MSALAVCAALLTSGCANLYVNDPQLTAKADAADASIQAANTSQPYTDQLANLKTFGAQEDLAVATLYASIRDRDVAGLLPLDDDARARQLNGEICGRLNDLLAGLCSGAGDVRVVARFAANYDDKLREQGDAADRAESYRLAFERMRRADDTRKIDCDTVLANPISPGEVQLYIMSRNCTALKQAGADADRLVRDLIAYPDGSRRAGAVADAYDAAHAKADAVTHSPADWITALGPQITAAKQLASSGEAASLEQFRKDIESVLSTGSAAVKLAGWTSVQDQLAALTTATVCAAPPQGAKAAGPKVDCASIRATSTGGRAGAVWALLQAFAAAGDANDPRMRSANWLAAATAIATAEKASAQLQADAEKAAAQAANLRFRALAREASLLAQARLYLQTGEGCGVARPSCALPAYVASWDRGRIPAAVLAFRDVQLLRETSVKRAKAAEAEQHVLLTSASASLKAYADGGVQPSDIAQLLADLGIFGATLAR